jgi:lantibiotic leader peptide-processing serine protease
MKQRKVGATLLAVTVALAGCQDLAPETITGEGAGIPQAAVAASTDGEYIVLLRGRVQNFRAAVEAAGGEVKFVHEGAGFAWVSGLSADGAGALARHATVAEIHADAAVSLEPMAALTDDIGISSQENPATAIRYSWQWNMRAIGAQHAWAAGKLGSPSVTVAILDTGIDYTSLDANGLVDLSRSTSFIASDNELRAAFFPNRHPVDDFNGHGTNVASQVASIGFAHAGVTSKTTLIGVKVLGATGSGTVGSVLSGVLFAVDERADVINLSLGGGFLRAGGAGRLVSLINRVFSYANRGGALIVVAAGNDAIDMDRNLIPVPNEEPFHAPSLYLTYCNSPHVLCVSATGPQTASGDPDIPAVYTNYGRSAVSVAAPGGNVGTTFSVWPWGNHRVSFVWSMCPINFLPNPANPLIRPCASGGAVNGYAGTSQAAPHAAGLAALLIAEGGKRQPSQIKAKIQQAADDLGQPGTDPFYGRGRINVPRALGLH